MFKVSTCIAAGFALATGAAAVPACADVGSIACTVFLRPAPLDRIARSLLGVMCPPAFFSRLSLRVPHGHA